MRPALERLLASPSALKFLRCFVGIAALPPPRICNHRARQPCLSRQKICTRNYTVNATKVRDTVEACRNDQPAETKSKHDIIPTGKARKQTEDVRLEEKEWLRRQCYNQWGLKPWTDEELDFESDLQQETDVLRLLDDPHFEQDLHLWAFLLDYRQKRYGLDGVAMIWESFRTRNINLMGASNSVLAGNLWSIFLSLGFEKHAIMEEICEYADGMYLKHGSRWGKLYVQVLSHFMINGTLEGAVHWHRRLFHIHRPSPKLFHDMCRHVITREGNLSALQVIYEESEIRDCYGRIVGRFYTAEDFPNALRWHYFLLSHGDLPKSFAVVFPLIRYLWESHNPGAQRVIKSLEDVGILDDLDQLKDLEDRKFGGFVMKRPEKEVAHSSTHPFQTLKLKKEFYGENGKSITQQPMRSAFKRSLNDNQLVAPQKREDVDLSRQNPYVNRRIDLAPGIGDVQASPKVYLSLEMMNRIHGEFHGIKPIHYNDNLGARWFASRWISLDLAINAIHALGLNEIGPLSLHAIALREPDSRDLSMRINQLKDLGISIGNSIFSLAVKRFAEGRKDSELKSLLSSDQHPTEYENFELQEKLLLQYHYAEDWTQFRRTLAILSLHNAAPGLEVANIILRAHARREDVFAMYDTMVLIAQNGGRVSGSTIALVVKCLLAPRQMGHRPSLDHDINIRMTISILKRLTLSGSQVPPRSWIEILRRLGMLGQLQDLEHLCLFLVKAYDPSNPTLNTTQHIPPGTKSNSSLHPYRQMFPQAFQTSLIGWGFIHALKNPSLPSHAYQEDGIPMPDVTFGIRLLKTLASNGVWVDFPPIKKAIVDRMIICYGPLNLTKQYNENARITLGLHNGVPRRASAKKMAKMIDNGLGFNVFSDLDIDTLIAERTRKRVRSKWTKFAHWKRSGLDAKVAAWKSGWGKI